MQPLKVLIIDDSALMRNIISKILNGDPEITVVATAMNGMFGLEKIERYRPDVIVLDLEMPVMNGIEFLIEKRKRHIGIPVIILSSVAKRGARITMEALSLGAADFILKPSGAVSHDIHEVEMELVQLVKIYGKRYCFKQPPDVPIEKPVTETEAPKVTVKEPPVFPRIPGNIEVIAIGISTGGPNALRKILPDIDKDIPVPLLVVQHMPKGFTFEFAKSLDKICPLEVKEAADGDIIKKGRILIAPGDRHLEVEKRQFATIVRLSEDEPVNGHRPSVDVLFSSVLDVYHHNCMAIIMTGMGKDGVAKIGDIFRQGGITVSQDEASCIVPGMPRAAIEKGYIRYVVTLDRMAETINTMTKAPLFSDA
ncbi:MAG: chemotaxis response regulator protein-glutamate methylesterase [Spirochaetales bacterium]|nr:chemotaxis response regulator protein-glutamate methylesterase [Spirochaetales bacterium]